MQKNLKVYNNRRKSFQATSFNYTETEKDPLLNILIFENIEQSRN